MLINLKTNLDCWKELDWQKEERVEFPATASN